MPVLTLSWQPYYEANTENYTGQTPWIKVVRWRRNDNNSLLPLNGLGVYVIEEQSTGTPLYAGQAQSFRDRFDGRSSALRELGLTAVPLADRIVRVATLNPQNELDLAETWLIRYLYLRDFALNNPRRLQNIDRTGPMYAPPDGLTINNNNTPHFLNVQYIYGGNNPITYP